MKRIIIMLILSTVLISGMGTCISSNIVFASQSESVLETEKEDPGENMEEDEVPTEIPEDSNTNITEKILEPDDEVDRQENELIVGDKQSLENVTNKKEELENDMQEEEQGHVEEQEAEDNEKIIRARLQVPQKLGITLDPFEINGKGQIYSEQYVIKNCGETAGILTLTKLVCRAGENSGIIIKTNKNEVHNEDEKFVYIEMVFGNGDTVILSPEGEEYKIWLEPGQELTFFYSGEINENAAQSWEEHDITVGMVYSWNIELDMHDDTRELEDLSDNKEEDFDDEPITDAWED